MSDQPTDPDRDRAKRQDFDLLEAPTGMDVDHFDDLAAPFALGALDSSEALEVEVHCRACPSCSRLVSEATWVAEMLPFLAPPMVPRAEAKAALFARIEQSPVQPSQPALPPALTIPASRPLLDPSPSRQRARRAFRLPTRIPALTNRGEPRLTSGFVLPMATAAVPLVLMLALVGAWGMEQQDQASERRGEIHKLTQRLRSLNQITGNGATVTTLSLSAGPAAPQTAGGTIFIDNETQQGVLMVEGLKGDDQNVTYQVLLTGNDSSVQATDLLVDKDGSGMATLKLENPLTEYKSVYVTAQPLAVGGGSPPTPPTDTNGALLMYMPASLVPTDWQATLGLPDIGSGSDPDTSGFAAEATPAP